MPDGKSEANEKEPDSGRGWPLWARWLATLAILVHVSAVLAGALGAPPASALEHEFAEFFEPYHQLLDQGDSYRYYSTAFPPTPVVIATLTFADGRPSQIVRIPERGLRPRLRVQRQLALAHGLMEDFQATRREAGEERKTSRWAFAFAKHLCKTNPGCSSVTLQLQLRLVPRIERIQELLKRPSQGPVDLDDEEFTTAPERIGVFPCDAS
jgi:hypothetical protein